MTSRMVGSVLTLVILLLSVAGGAAQTYTQMQWGMNKAVTPYAFGANINGTWRDLGTVSSAGAWSLSLSNLTVSGSATLPYIQGGAGAVATTVNAKLDQQDISVKDFGAKCDAYVSYELGFPGTDVGSINSGSATFTVAAYNFTSADIGKSVSIHGAGPAGAVLGTTISAIVSTHVATLAASASTTVSNTNFSLGTDDTTAIQNAINWAATSPSTRTVVIPPNAVCGLKFPGLNISTSYVHIKGSQPGEGPYNNYSGPNKVNSGLAWVGGESGVMLRVAAPTGATSFELYGVTVENIGLAANNLATFGMQISAVRYSHFKNIYCEEATGSCIDVAGEILTPFGGYCGVQFSDFSHISGLQIVSSAPTLRSLGNVTCNSSLNTFTTIETFSKDGTAIVASGSDNNLWDAIILGYYLGGAATNSFYMGTLGGYPTNNEFIRQFSSGLPLFADTGTYANWITIDNGNGTPDVAGPGQYFQTNSSGIIRNVGLLPALVGDSVTDITTARTARTSAPNTSAIIANGASDHLRLTDGTNNWSVNINGGSNNFRINKIAGAGTAVELISDLSVTGSATINSGVTVGVAGTTVGSVAFKNATSGTITLQPTTGALGTVTATLPANTGTIAETNLAQTFSATQTFTAPIVLASYTIGALPTCNAGALGSIVTVSNGTDYATGTYGSAVSATGIVTRSVLCTNTAGATTYAWAYN